MEWADVAELLAYWVDHPPIHELVAAYLGVKPKPRPTSTLGSSISAADPSGIGDLIRGFPAGVVPVGR